MLRRKVESDTWLWNKMQYILWEICEFIIWLAYNLLVR